MSLVNIPVHTLGAGGKQLLQSSHNASGLDASSVSHLRCNLRLKNGSRHFIVGRNGCGKTTLLRAIAFGELEGWPQDLQMQLVDQDTYVDLECSPIDIVLGADSRHLELVELEEEAAELEHQLEQLCCDGNANEAESAGLRLCEIYDIIEQSDDRQRLQRAKKVLRGLGFEDDNMNVPLHQLSGGWRMRSRLAAALFMEPQLLLLDEPNNHLDLDAIKWLQKHLVHEFPGTLLCVSHDRAFVNAVADEIIVFTESNNLEYFSGNLDNLHKHAEKIARRGNRHDSAREKQMHQIEKKKNKLEHQFAKMESGLSKHKENNNYGIYQGLAVTNIDKASARAKKESKKLERLQREVEGQGPHAIDPSIGQVIAEHDDSWAAALAPRFQNTDSALKFAFREAEPLNLPGDISMLELHDVSFCYPNGDRNVLSNMDLSITEKCRIAITGKNGAGKSTLVQLLTRHLIPTCGEVVRHPNLRIAYFGQHDAEMLQQHHVTPLQYLEECFPKMRTHELCTQLIHFGITQETMNLQMSELSGGQRMRIAFARMCAEQPHLLVLDEPTNHLDIYAIEALCDALKDFQGGVVIVTHNKYLIEEVADTRVVVDAQATRMEKASLVDIRRFNHDT